jgi:DNA polymerase-3 subunit beta
MNTDIAAATALSVRCSRDDLAASLGVVARATSSRGAVQVLSGILLQAEEGKLTLAATDMEISIRASLSGEVSGDAAVVVPGRLLTDLVRLLPDDSVTLVHEEGDGVLAVTSGTHSSRLNVYSAEDFPRLPPIDIPLQRVDAQRSCRRSIWSDAASRDESRPVLTGVLVRFEGNRLIMARPTRIVSRWEETALTSPAPELDAIILLVPSRAHTPASGAEAVELGVHGTTSSSLSAMWPTSRRIDGQLPNYKQLPVSRPRSRHRVSRLGSSVVLGSWLNGTHRFACLQRIITISAQIQDVGEATESLPIDFSGEEIEIGFNPDFLRDGLEAVSGETVELKRSTCGPGHRVSRRELRT